MFSFRHRTEIRIEGKYDYSLVGLVLGTEQRLE